jgi:histone-lysine N-methyltransferase SETMAR
LDHDVILVTDCLPKIQTINAKCYLSLLVRLKDILEEKRLAREGHQGGLVLARQCPGSPGTYNPEETGLTCFQSLDHSPYSPDLAPSDYHLLPGLKKKQIKGLHFSSDTDVIAAAETWLDGQLLNFFFEWLANF